MPCPWPLGPRPSVKTVVISEGTIDTNAAQVIEVTKGNRLAVVEPASKYGGAEDMVAEAVSRQEIPDMVNLMANRYYLPPENRRQDVIVVLPNENENIQQNNNNTELTHGNSDSHHADPRECAMCKNQGHMHGGQPAQQTFAQQPQLHHQSQQPAAPYVQPQYQQYQQHSPLLPQPMQYQSPQYQQIPQKAQQKSPKAAQPNISENNNNNNGSPYQSHICAVCQQNLSKPPITVCPLCKHVLKQKQATTTNNVTPKYFCDMGQQAGSSLQPSVVNRNKHSPYCPICNYNTVELFNKTDCLSKKGSKPQCPYRVSLSKTSICSSKSSTSINSCEDILSRLDKIVDAKLEQLLKPVIQSLAKSIPEKIERIVVPCPNKSCVGYEEKDEDDDSRGTKKDKKNSVKFEKKKKKITRAVSSCDSLISTESL